MSSELVAEYKPREYIIEIYKNIDLHNPLGISEDDFSTIFHEFLHYYQDVASGFRVNLLSTRNNLFKHIHHESKNAVSVSIPYDFRDNFRYNYELYRFYNNMDVSVSAKLNVADCINIDVKVIKDCVDGLNADGFFLSVGNPLHSVLEYPVVIIGEDEYLLNGHLIEEGMAAMYECAINPVCISSYRYVALYDIPRLVAEHILDTKIDCLAVGMLCEYALEFHNPGLVFMHVLDFLKENGYRPDIKSIKQHAAVYQVEFHGYPSLNNTVFSFTDYRKELLNEFQKSLQGICVNAFIQDYCDYLGKLAEKAYIRKSVEFLPIFHFLKTHLPADKYRKEYLSLVGEYNPIIEMKLTGLSPQIVSYQGPGSKYNVKKLWWYWGCLEKFWNYICYPGEECPLLYICEHLKDIVPSEECRMEPYTNTSADCLFNCISSHFNLSRKIHK